VLDQYDRLIPPQRNCPAQPDAQQIARGKAGQSGNLMPRARGDLHLDVPLQSRWSRTQYELFYDPKGTFPLAQQVPPGDLPGVQAAQVDRHPGGRLDPFTVLVVGLEPPNPHPPVLRQQEQLLTPQERSASQASRDDQPGPFDGKCPVHVQPGDAPAPGRGTPRLPGHRRRLRRLGPRRVLRLRQLAENQILELVDALSAARRNGDDGRLEIAEPAALPGDLFADLGDPLGRGQVRLGDHRYQPGNAHQAQDPGVVGGLLHPAVIRGHGQQCQVQGPGPGHHVADETLMTGHIDHPHRLPLRGEEVGESQIDGQASAFFFRQPVCVDPGESLDQQGLAVIHMSGGSDHVHAGLLSGGASWVLTILRPTAVSGIPRPSAPLRAAGWPG
jgi:hypothetical protein